MVFWAGEEIHRQCLAKSSPCAGPSAGAEVARFFYGSGTFGAFWSTRAGGRARDPIAVQGGAGPFAARGVDAHANMSPWPGKGDVHARHVGLFLHIPAPLRNR